MQFTQADTRVNANPLNTTANSLNSEGKMAIVGSQAIQPHTRTGEGARCQ